MLLGQKRIMNSIRQMVDALRNNPEVVGLMEYGSAHHSDEEIHGDYDLVVVVEERDPEVESLHFRVGGVPVDLNIRSLGDIRDMRSAVGFDAILLDGRIVHDPSGRLAEEIQALRQRDGEAPRQQSKPNVPSMRHGHRHILDKVRDRRESMPTLSSYLLHQGAYWLARQYFEIRNLEFRGDKHALEFLREHEPVIFTSLERFYRITDHAEQTELFRSMAEAVLAPVGGLWRDDEVLTFGDQKKGRALFRRLLGEG